MYRIAIDVGGTHTDGLVLSDSGEIVECKAPTTPDDLAEGIIHCLGKAATSLNSSISDFLSQVGFVILGTTVTTNTLVQGTGAKTGLIATKGFRDIVELRRGRRETRFNFKVDFPTMLAPRYLRRDVRERVHWNGQIDEPLEENDVREAAQYLRGKGVESVAVTFMHSYVNPSHEKRAAEIVRQTLPDVFVSASSGVVPLLGEFERFSTTVVDAYIGPSFAKHIGDLTERLGDLGFKGRLFVGESNGGLMTSEMSMRKPIWTISSGPCAAPVAGLYLGESLNTKDIITIDAGGTSFDVCLVKGGEVPVTTEKWINWQRVAIPVVDVHSIGAGGGSVAWIDVTGMLRVGPRSAGAKPGPACYDKGGVEPTVTDADLFLGYLNPDNFLGGAVRLRRDLAEEALREKIAKPLGTDTATAAESVIRVLVPGMASAIREVAVKRGYDPRESTLIVGGGAGPVHGAPIAEELGIKRFLVPRLAASFCAFGWLRSDMRFELVRSFILFVASPEEADLGAINGMYEEMEDEAVAALGSSRDDLSLLRTLDVRYDGQFRELELPVPVKELTPADLADIVDRFHQKHHQLYGFSQTDRPLEFVNYRSKAIIEVMKPEVRRLLVQEQSPEAAQTGSRDCWFNGDPRKSRIYDGDKLQPGNTLEGPAVVELPATTIVVPPEFACRVDEFANFVVSRQ